MTPIVELVAPRLLPLALVVAAALITKGYADVGEGFGAGVIVGLAIGWLAALPADSGVARFRR